jgi:hypothetical protein
MENAHEAASSAAINNFPYFGKYEKEDSHREYGMIELLLVSLF